MIFSHAFDGYSFTNSEAVIILGCVRPDSKVGLMTAPFRVAFLFFLIVLSRYYLRLVWRGGEKL